MAKMTTVRLWIYKGGEYQGMTTLMEDGRLLATPERFRLMISEADSIIPTINGLASDGRQETIMPTENPETGEMEDLVYLI
jgi:hypothetical protein